ncbi:hypothetical protein [Hymenobacter aerilatus]|nr:hypothetical protein [Hymenobacter aerilatus]
MYTLKTGKRLFALLIHLPHHWAVDNCRLAPPVCEAQPNLAS